MSDPNELNEGLTGMLQNSSFSGDEAGSGQGEDPETDGIEIEGEPDADPERIEPGQG